MKKTALFLGVMSIMTIVSCKKKDETPVPPPAPIATETPAAPVPVPDEEKDGTTIKVGGDGIGISTKDGKKQTDVNVSNGDASVEIKK